jgi:NADH-quinone oxidoreductase subunit E
VKLFEEALGIKMGETTEDGLFTLQYTSCIGACNVAPAMKIGEKVHGHLDEQRIKDILNSYREGSICQNK